MQFTTSQGIHRINRTEIENYGGGSLWDQLVGHVGGALTGENIPKNILDDMEQMQKRMAQGSVEKYNNSIKTINKNYGSSFEPVQMEDLQGGDSDPFAKFGGKTR